MRTDTASGETGDTVAVIGLGYVGLPLFLLCRKQGLDVVGYDVDEAKIDTVQRRENPLGEELDDFDDYIAPEQVSADETVLDGADHYIITVPTPVRGKEPDYSYVESAAKTVSQYLDTGDTVILESTIAPGTTRNVVKPLIKEASGLSVGEDVYLAHCPERVDPGNDEWPLQDIPRVVGACSDAGLERAAALYDRILDGDVFAASAVEVAEASKITENAFRDVNIAFVNELAKILDNLDISTTEVIDAASTKPFGFMAHWPGCGVGGHCIPVDPYYLIKESENNGFSPALLQVSRDINESMPQYTVQRVIEGLNAEGLPVKDTDIALLGLSYKGGVGDKRESPAYVIKDRLEAMGAHLTAFDPYLDESDANTLDEVLDATCLVIATDHPVFNDLEDADLTNVQLIVDGRNMLDSDKISAQYIGVGSN